MKKHLCLEFPEFHYNSRGLSQSQALWLLAQPCLGCRVIMVHSLLVVSLMGCYVSPTRSKKQPPWWHWIELLQTGQLMQHPSCDMHCHSTSAALIVLIQGQLPPELPASRPDSGRCDLFCEDAKANSLPPPSQSINLPSSLCQPKSFPWDADHSSKSSHSIKEKIAINACTLIDKMHDQWEAVTSSAVLSPWIDSQ